MAVHGKKSLMYSLPALLVQFKYAIPRSLVAVRDRENVDVHRGFGAQRLYLQLSESITLEFNQFPIRIKMGSYYTICISDSLC